MARQRKESDEDRQQSAIYLANCLWKGKDRELKAQEIVEGLLGLPKEFFADHMYVRRTRTRNGPGPLKVRGLHEVDYVVKSQLGCDKGRLDEQYVFELGLRQLLNRKLPPSGIARLLSRRHGAQVIFEKGCTRMRGGHLPETKPGRPKKWTKVTPAEARAALEEWIDEIEAYGCRVMDAEQWLDWFKYADPAETMEVFLQTWADAWPLGEAPCPPIYGLDLELWEHNGMLGSTAFVDRLILVTESDMPYSVYHARFEQPKRKSSLCSPEITAEQFDGDEWETEWHGDDIGARAIDRNAQIARSEADAATLIDRTRRRKSGGVN
ncbi:hypothetical protein [Paraburkholderia dinghuensis]|uniref:Uncharacterized protein n=1 Tax=Paraburkholderia dinghuensis TaxID=2305225 RepID=A0A3N6QAJ6_9BURK|nr:hypothetical protein [Paraburkholderia dinghuensis]RQH09606.1 hypothetical protein D1Y85_00095 [Paraburkholderia dinghuensis]